MTKPKSHSIYGMIIVLGTTLSTFGFASSSFDEAYRAMNLGTLKANIKQLSSDKFGGRAPATKGGQLTTDFLVEHFNKMNLKPGNGNSYLQRVPLVSIVSKPKNKLSIGTIKFEYPKNFVANSRQTKTSIGLKDSELVFVGYGINAPEYRWNDYAGVDVKNKTVVILVNDPGYATQDQNLFNGNAMTYYGRWTYKFEEAARQGATGAMIIHETKPASYGWNVVESSWTGTQYHLPTESAKAPVLDVEMWISVEKAHELFDQSQLDFLKLKTAASHRDFKAVSLKQKASIELENRVEKSYSNNVIATLPGSVNSDQHVVYMAHWDHIGQLQVDGKTRIYNGAHDNASGTAGLLEIARAFKTLKSNPRRSITLIAVTAEEQGRLGSRYFADNPTIPLNRIVGLINMDSLNITGLKKDVTVVGFGKSELENYLARAAERQHRKLTPEKTPERGYYYRSDHFSLALKGVPGLSAGGGAIAKNTAQAQIAERMDKTVARCYHQDCDEYSEDWGWEGVIADLQMYFETGYLLAESEQWPNWRQGTEFKAARDAMMKEHGAH